MANQFLSLSLFLMLLSFFIIMNAVSSYDESKSAPVMTSVALAFSTQTTTELESNPVQQADPTNITSVREGDTLDALQGLFDAHIAGFEATKNRLGTIMHIKTTVQAFEDAIDLGGVSYSQSEIGETGSFLKTMVTLLRSEDKGEPYRMDMLINLPQDAAFYQKESPEKFLQNLKKVSAFAQDLEDSGLPKRLVNAGLVKGEEEFMDIYIYRYKAFNLEAEIQKEKLQNSE